MDIILIIYLILLLLIIIGGIFWAGYDGQSSHDTEEFVFHVIVIGLFWPFMLAMFCFVAPFWGIYSLGKLIKSKRKTGNKDI